MKLKFTQNIGGNKAGETKDVELEADARLLIDNGYAEQVKTAASNKRTTK